MGTNHISINNIFFGSAVLLSNIFFGLAVLLSDNFFGSAVCLFLEGDIISDSIQIKL